MRKTTAIPINGKTIVVRELTPREIDALFDQCRQRTRTTVDDILDVHHLDTVLLGAMLGLAPERCEALVGELTTSEYMPLVEAAKTLNPDFSPWPGADWSTPGNWQTWARSSPTPTRMRRRPHRPRPPPRLGLRTEFFNLAIKQLSNG